MKNGYIASVKLMKEEVKEMPLSSFVFLCTIIIGGFMEGIGISLLFPILDLISSSGHKDNPVSQKIFFVFDKISLTPNIGNLLIFFLLAFLIQAGSKYYSEKIATINRVDFENRLRKKLINSAFSSEWPFFLNSKCGELTNSVITETVLASNAYYCSMKVLAVGFIILVYVAFSFIISIKLTLVALIIFFVMNRMLKTINQKSFILGEMVANFNNLLHGFTVDILSGAKFIKQSAIEKVIIENFSKLSDTLSLKQAKVSINHGKVAVIFEPLVIAFISGYLYVSQVIVGLEISGIMVFVIIIYRLYPKVSFFNELVNIILSQIPSYSNLLRLNEKVLFYKREKGGEFFHNLEGDIRVENVYFSYNSGKIVLNGVNLHIQKGQITALAGSSGSGKTTLLDLISGLLEPSAGRILIGGNALKEYDQETWRRRISYVDQTAIFFHDSILANLKISNPDATNEELMESLKMAHAHEFIEEFSEKYNTIIGDRGVRLSGGQRQRLALARALLRKPDILILDEATSSLDTYSESMIKDTIEKLRGKLTVIIVAHRLSTIKNADRIYVIDNGKVAEEGTYQELVENKNILAHFHALS